MVSADSIDRSDMPAHRCEQLVQSVVDYAIYMLDPSGHVVSWNAGAQRIKLQRRRSGRPALFAVLPRRTADGRPECLLRQALEQGVHRMKAGGYARMARSSGRWPR